MRNILHIVFLSALLLTGGSLCAQDLHFSQFFNSPLTTNPANTGFIPDANYRLGINYRNQWTSVPVPYKTMSAFGDFQVFREKLEFGWLGIGGVILRDVAGSGNLTSTKVYGSIAYHQLLGESSLLSLGFNAGTANKRIDMNKLTFDNQWNGKFFDAAAPSGEPITQSSITYYDMQVGMNYAYFPNDNVYINTGFSVHHVNKPRESFYSSNNQIDRRYIGFLNASIKVSDVLILNPSAYYTTQAGAQETVMGGYAAYNLQGNGDKQLFGGLYYRLKDAAFFLLGYQLGNVRMMFNYDVTTSSLATTNTGRGAYELSIIYLGIYPSHHYSGSRKLFLCPRF